MARARPGSLAALATLLAAIAIAYLVVPLDTAAMLAPLLPAAYSKILTRPRALQSSLFSLSQTIKPFTSSSTFDSYRPFTTTTTNNNNNNKAASDMATRTSGASSTSFLDAVHARRTYVSSPSFSPHPPYPQTFMLTLHSLHQYSLNKTSPISDSRIEEIARVAIKDVPSSFNSQSTRLVVLLKDQHDKFWDVTKEILKAIVPEDSWSHTEQRLNGFRAGYGTVSPQPPIQPKPRPNH